MSFEWLAGMVNSQVDPVIGDAFVVKSYELRFVVFNAVVPIGFRRHLHFVQSASEREQEGVDPVWGSHFWADQRRCC